MVISASSIGWISRAIINIGDCYPVVGYKSDLECFLLVFMLLQ